MFSCSMYTKELLIPSNSIVRDSEKRDQIFALLKKVWNVENLTPNPCALPISLEHKHVSYIQENAANYTVAEKSDGVRYIMALGKYSNGNCFSVMLDRNFVPYEIAVAAREEIFQGGTVMDGELIWEYYSSVHAPRQLYLIFDALCQSGKDCQTKNYIDRLNTVHSLFYLPQYDLQFCPEEWTQQAAQYAAEYKVVSLGNSHNLVFAEKSCQSINNIDILVRNLNTFHHKSDGLLFTPINERVRRGRHQTMFKWKKKHTIDILLHLSREDPRDHRWEFQIYIYFQQKVQSCENLVHYNDKCVRFLVVRGKFLRSMLAHLEKQDITEHEVLVEALVSPATSPAATSPATSPPTTSPATTSPPTTTAEETDDVWDLEPVALRKDKNVPNALQTIERTLVNISESISIENLVDFFSASSASSHQTSELGELTEQEN